MTDDNTTAMGSPPREKVDERTRQLRDLVSARLDDYLELMRNSARAWDRREVDAKRVLQDSAALFEFAVRDATWWYRQALESVPLPSDPTTSSALSVEVPILEPKRELTLACTDLTHAEHVQHTIPGHAIAVTPNPVQAGARAVEVAFDPFGKPAGSYVGKLVAWTDDQSTAEPYADVVFYVGGNNQRF